MNLALIQQEICVVLTGLAILLLDLVTPAVHKPKLPWLGIAVLSILFLSSWSTPQPISPGDTIVAKGHSGPLHVRVVRPHAETVTAHPLDKRSAETEVTLRDATPVGFHGSHVQDSLARFFKTLFLLGGLLTLVITREFAARLPGGAPEFAALVLFALAGMMFAASAHGFPQMFVAIELITITFYILASYQRNRLRSLEAGVKYLVLGATASAILVFGIALVYGASGALGFSQIAALEKTGFTTSQWTILQIGFLLVLAGLGFKLAMVPFQVWAPDVYQGAPAPAAAFLAIGSKVAGVALLLRVADLALGLDDALYGRVLPWLAAATLLYGTLCALPQRNLKRLLAYSGIAHAGYLLLGFTVFGEDGTQAILYYLAGYTFAVAAAFLAITLACPEDEDEDLSTLAGLHRRSPLLAGVLTLAVVSLAGLPPLAGFLGKFLVLRAVLAEAVTDPALAWLAGIALFSVVVSLYYYFGIIREIFWGEPAPWEPKAPRQKLALSRTARATLVGCAGGLVVLGVYPRPFLAWAEEAAKSLFAL